MQELCVVQLTLIDYTDPMAQNVGNDRAFSFSAPDLLNSITINVAGPGYLAQILLPLLEKGKRKVIMNTTSCYSSMGMDYGPRCSTYSISKVAVNMLVSTCVLLLCKPYPTHRIRPTNRPARSQILRSSALTLAGSRQVCLLSGTFICVCSPVFCAAMGGKLAVLEPFESVTRSLKLLTSITPADSGKFFKYDGTVLPW